MLFTLIIGAAAGAATKPLQPRITEAVIRILGQENLPDAGGRKVLAFALMMTGAAIVLSVLDAPSQGALMLVSGLVGYFQAEIREAIIRRRG